MDSSKRNMLMLGVLVALGFAISQLPSPTEEPAVAESSESSAATESSSTTGTRTNSEDPEPLDEASLQARLDHQVLATIETDLFIAQMSNLNTGLVSFTLKADQFTIEGEPIEMVTTDREAYFPFQIALPGIPIPLDAVWEIHQQDERTAVFTWHGDGLTVVRRIEAGTGPYQLWSTTRVHNESDASVTFRLTHRVFHYVEKEDEDSGGIGRPSTSAAFGVCGFGDDEVERAPSKDLVEDPRGFAPNVRFTGINNAYFAIAMAGSSANAERCVLHAEHRGVLSEDEYHGTLVEAELRYPRITLAPGEENTTRVLGFAGPSGREVLRAAAHGLPELVDLGWFSFIANGLSEVLSAIQGYVHNWGFAIILLTLMVKFLFFPLTVKSFRAMGRMRQLKPQIDAINKKYEDDSAGKGSAIMALYKKEGVSPLAGCLPSVLQMPVWFALYRSISTNVDLYHAPFIAFWTDLSAPDPYFVLPVFVGGLMHVQQRLTPNTMDSQQAKIMMYVMPLMIGGFMLFLPAGLCLYMVTNSSLTMLQQRAIYAKLDAEAAARPKPSEDDGDDDDDDAGDNNDSKPSASLESSSASASRRSLGSKKSKKKRQRRG